MSDPSSGERGTTLGGRSFDTVMKEVKGYEEGVGYPGVWCSSSSACSE